jgi:hypothetical protein
MPITISGTTVTFNDSSSQTTNVPNATAALSVGAIGTYALLNFPGNTTNRAPGFTQAGSSLRYAATVPGGTSIGGQENEGTAPSGTWRLMGGMYSFSPSPKSGAYARTSVWLRIS